MSTYTQILYQIVFSTKNRERSLTKENRDELFKYIWGLLQNKKLFQNFNGWQEGYGAFTYSIKEKDRLIEYVKNQEEHHRVKTFKEEYIGLLQEHRVEFDEKYLL